MAPLPPQPSRPSSRASSIYVDATDDRQPQQAGRKASNLAAQASAQAMREASRPSSRSSLGQLSSSPNVLRKKSRTPVASSSPVDLVQEEETPPPPPAHSTLPARPGAMPLISVSSSDSGNAVSIGSKQSDETEGSTPSGSDLARTKAATAAGTPLAAQIAASTPSASLTPGRRPLLQPSEMTQRDSTLSLTRQTTPRTVRDLGSDYTRYFNPFIGNNSQQDLSTPLPRYNSSTHLIPGSAGGVSAAEVHKRLSDPFGDTKRQSDPFGSRPHTAPGTPRHKYLNPEKQAEAAAMTAPGTPGRPHTPAFIHEADPEKAAFFPYLDDRLGAPEYAFPLFADEKEDDDDMHMPQWDDDVRLKPKMRDHFTRENVASTLGMIFMLLGLLCVFVVLPVVSYTTRGLIDYTYETPLSEMPSANPTQPWATVNNKQYPLLTNLRTGLIDPDTPASAKTRTGINGQTYNLVFSDEFNEKNRTFYPGDDPYWFGGDFWYAATQDLEWYDPDAINTGDGTLQIQLDAFNNHGLDYRSGMLNSWNQICFKGGIFEVSMSLPGPAGVHGWWPGVWTMGNLGRPGHLATTDGLWPYTYNDCDSGITPNQSMTDGTSNLPGQRLPSCTCVGEDHPSPGVGRGAPEIDIAEVSADWGGHGWGVATQSYQVAPFDIWYYPNYEFMETPNYNISMVNTYTGGPFQQAVSTTTVLNNEWYDGKQYQKYAFEYVPGSTENSYVAWTIGDNDEMMKFDARAVGPTGNIGQRLISEEPMSMIINLGFSHSWVAIDWQHLVFPTVMRVDYVRWYQLPGQEMVTCDPPGYETTEYIANHPEPYNNPNLTTWSQAGYSRPKNSLMDGCQAAQPSATSSAARSTHTGKHHG